MSANEQKTSRELAIIAAQAADEKKATDILVQDVAELVGETDFFVIVLPPRGAVERRPRARFGEGSGALRCRVLRPHLEASA